MHLAHPYLPNIPVVLFGRKMHDALHVTSVCVLRIAYGPRLNLLNLQTRVNIRLIMRYTAATSNLQNHVNFLHNRLVDVNV